MYDKCPSKSMRDLKAKIYRCRNCGAEVEMFSDELRTRCRKCRSFIYKEQMPYCIQGHLDMAISTPAVTTGYDRQAINLIAKEHHEIEIGSGKNGPV